MSVDKGHLANGSGRSRSPYRSGSSKLVALRIQKAPEPIPLADPEMIALNPEMPERKTDQEMLRIEIQTADPNIRIIWFAPKTDSSPDKLFNDNK